MHENDMSLFASQVAALQERTSAMSEGIAEFKQRVSRAESKIEDLQHQSIALERITVTLENLGQSYSEQQKINKDITKTLGDITTTLAKTNDKIDTTTKETNGKIDALNKKMEEIDNRVEDEEESHKIDFLALIKSNMLKILAGAIVVYEVFMKISK